MKRTHFKLLLSIAASFLAGTLVPFTVTLKRLRPAMKRCRVNIL
jgi:hypothetical protein